MGGSGADESFYDRLAGRSRRSGDLSLPEWRPPQTGGGNGDGPTRERLRSEMERIVEAEAEGSRDPAPAQPQGGKRMKLAKFVKFREEKFGAVLFETRAEKVYTLNPTGAAVVREIVSGGEGDVLARLKSRFNDPSGAMETEASAFIDDLKSKGLLSE